MGHDVFISFSSKDNDTALRVYDGLKTRGVKCWISSKDIPAGGNYFTEIANALSIAKVMVLVFSGNANSSQEILKELSHASKFQLIIMPLKIDNVVPSKAFSLGLGISQWLEVFPDFERSLDDVAITIKAITEKSDKFSMQVRQALEEDGVIGPTERKFLVEDAISIGLTNDQAAKIINDVVGSSAQLNIKEREIEYCQIIAEVLEDGNISHTERRGLANKAHAMGISDSRAQALLEQEAAKLGLAVASEASTKPSILTAETTTNAIEDNLREQGTLAVPNETSSLKPSGNDDLGNSLNNDLRWPVVGLNFLKVITKELEASKLPFTPVLIADDEDIKEENQTFWQVDSSHYVGIWLDTGSRRLNKITVYWGYYSDYEKRDPVFRRVCDDILRIPGALDVDGSFRVNGYAYEFCSKDYLGFETSERLTFEVMAQDTCIKRIVAQVLTFSWKIWPAVSGYEHGKEN